MPRVGFEPTIPMFVRAKTVHASDRAATVIGLKYLSSGYIPNMNLRYISGCDRTGKTGGIAQTV
jgi:hypothetical protein